MQGWNLKRVYYARHKKPAMDEMGVEKIEEEDEFLKACDLVTINTPLSDSTKGKAKVGLGLGLGGSAVTGSGLRGKR